jgi:hypothetical protein
MVVSVKNMVFPAVTMCSHVQRCTVLEEDFDPEDEVSMFLKGLYLPTKLDTFHNPEYQS